MKRSLILIAPLLACACVTPEAGPVVEPPPLVERAAPEDVGARVMAIAEEALAFCPGSADTDARPLIRAAERAGWPRFFDDEYNDGVSETDRLGPGDPRKASVRRVEATDGSGWGQVRLILLRRARPEGDLPGAIACWVEVVPRNRGIPRLITRAEIADAVATMTRVAGRPPDETGEGPAPTAAWSAGPRVHWVLGHDDGLYYMIGNVPLQEP